MAGYKLTVPPQAVGANLVYFDFFNVSIGSGKSLRVASVLPFASGAVAVSGVVAVDLFLTRTTAVGTGGTAATVEGTTLTASTFSALDNSTPINTALMSARLTPTGGATAGALIAQRSIFSEETNAGTYTPNDFIRPYGPSLIVPAGSGIRVVQGAVASVGNVGFDVYFEIRE